MGANFNIKKVFVDQKKERSPAREVARSGDRRNEIIAIFLFALSFFIFISLSTFDYSDLPMFTSTVNNPVSNFAGTTGAYLGAFLLVFIGMSAYIIPALILFWGVLKLAGAKSDNYPLKVFGSLILVLASSASLSLIGGSNSGLSFTLGGITGLACSQFLLKYLGWAGSVACIIVLMLLSVLIATDFLIFPIISAIVRFVVKIFKKFLVFIKEKKSSGKPAAGTSVKQPAQKPSLLNIVKKINPVIAKPVIIRKAEEKRPVVIVKKEEPKTTGTPKKPEAKKTSADPSTAEKALPAYVLPGLDLLKSPPPAKDREIKDDLTENSKILETILNDFDVEAKVIEVTQGPVITRYELEAGAGVRVHKITSLCDNIALGMKAQSVRIVAPIPGKGTIGIEVPNSKSVMVFLKEILESAEYAESSSKLKMALGKDIAGSAVIADLAKMPHLLIAGTTGSGKTVCVNCIIASLLFNASPDEVKFIMIDPKKVELAQYNELPHLLCPVITDYKKAPIALEWLVNEMQKRYDVLSKSGVRNIESYNNEAAKGTWDPMYYIVVIIDELADLMMVARAEIESTITRLAQLSRAVGIHLILATQRPSVNVITGVIKANFPARISFKVASKVDSRTVLDQNGADVLLGRGDMIFIEPTSDKPMRAQGALVYDDEILRFTDFIKSQRKPDYVDEIFAQQKKSFGMGAFKRDDIYEEAVRIVVQTKQASVSMVQRKLGVGYAKAARLIDMMEEDGIVGPYQGSKPRELLMENVPGITDDKPGAVAAGNPENDDEVKNAEA